MKGEASELIGTETALCNMTPNFCKSSMLKPVFMCWYRAGNIWIKAAEKAGWEWKLVYQSSRRLGAFRSILYQVFHTAHQRFKSSSSSVTTGGSELLYLPSLSPMESVLTNGLFRLGPGIGPKRTGTGTLTAGGVSGLSESLAGDTICKISWKLFSAARDASLFLLSAADCIWSRRTSHALEKSPIWGRGKKNYHHKVIKLSLC